MCAVDQMDVLNDELSAVHHRAAESEQKLTNADEDLRKKDQQL